MPIRFSVHPTARLVTYSVEGKTTREDVRKFLDAVLADPDFERGYGFLGDRRKAGGDPDMAYVRAFAREVAGRARLLAPCRWAVAAPTSESFRMVRLWGILTLPCGVEAAPFMTPAEGIRWLVAGAPERRALAAC